MKIQISRISNGLIVEFDAECSPGDPLGVRSEAGIFFAHDGTDLMGLISERIEKRYGFQNEGSQS